MANNVFANGREVSCKKADGKSICAFPDVCMTPPENPATPPGLPVPYPNTGMAKDTTSGSKNVKISGQEVMLKNKSYFKKSTGDEAGSAAKKGVITSINRGKVYFTTWSMNVKAESQNVVRHLDLTTHNHASQPSNSPPMAHLDTMAAPPPPEQEKKGNLKVKVTDKCTGDPIADADVEVGKFEKKTSSSGEAEFSDLLVGGHGADVDKRFPEADYIRFIIHYPAIFLRREARSSGGSSGEVNDGSTTDIEIELTVYRVVEPIVFHRRHIDLDGEDKYGHWWTVVSGGESYGWWPKYGLGSSENRRSEPPSPPAPLPAGAGRLAQIQFMFSSAVYQAQSALYGLKESSVWQTFRGVEGELNGQTSFGGTATKDPHHPDSGDEQYKPVLSDCRTDSDIQDCLRGFSRSYSGGWSWFLEFGNHCHTFQKKSISHCRMEMFKKVK